MKYAANGVMSRQIYAVLIVNYLEQPVFYKFSSKIHPDKMLEIQFQMHAALDSFENVYLETLVSPDMQIYGMATPFKHKIVVYTPSPMPYRDAEALLRAMSYQWYNIVMCPFWDEEKAQFIEELGNAYVYQFMIE